MSRETAARPTLTGAGVGRLVDGPWRVVVTGAGGWMGQASLELLRGVLGDAFESRVVAFGSSRRPLAELGGLAPEPTLVLHLAFLTQEKLAGMPREDYIGANRVISDTVFTALDAVGAEAIFIPSSGAARVADDPQKTLYGDLKRGDEDRARAWAESGGKRAVIARIFGLSGPYINKPGAYALACFIADALAGRPIRVEAARPVFRSPVAVSELMSIVLGLMTDGEAGSTLFDTAGEREYEMGDMAAAVAAALGHRAGVTRPPLQTTTPERYVGDPTAYRAHRARLAVTPVPFPDQVRATARFMTECRNRARVKTPLPKGEGGAHGEAMGG